MRGRKPKCLGRFSDKEGIHEAYNTKLSTHGDYCDCDFYCITLCGRMIECITKQEKGEGISKEPISHDVCDAERKDSRIPSTYSGKRRGNISRYSNSEIR